MLSCGQSAGNSKIMSEMRTPDQWGRSNQEQIAAVRDALKVLWDSSPALQALRAVPLLQQEMLQGSAAANFPEFSGALNEHPDWKLNMALQATMKRLEEKK